MGDILAVLAVLIVFLTFFFYIRNILKSRNHKNLTTWLVWFFVSSIDALSFLSVTGSYIKAGAVLIDSICCLMTFCSILSVCLKSEFKPMDKWEKRSFVVGLLSLIVFISRSGFWANLSIQVGYAFAFVPLCVNPDEEKPKYWFSWAIAYALTLAVVVIKWRGNWIDTVTPSMDIILHSIVAVSAYRYVHKT